MLTRRPVVLSLILALAGAVCLAAIFPQRAMLSPAAMVAWRADHPFLALLADGAGLDHVFTTVWFFLLLLLFSLSLAVSLTGQIRAARRKLVAFSSADAAGWLPVAAGPQSCRLLLARHGYRRMGEKAGVVRYLRQPLGFFGGVCLHAAMLLAAAGSLVVFASEQRGLLHLYEGESEGPGRVNWQASERGLLAGDFRLPFGVRLLRVAPEFWPDDALRSLASESVLVTKAAALPLSLSINAPLRQLGVRMYQSTEYGHAFFVELTGPDGQNIPLILQISQPSSRRTPAYQDFVVSGLPAILQAKYWADAKGLTMAGGEPRLVLRLTEAPDAVRQAELVPGQAVALGRWQARLIEVRRWTGLIFVRQHGMEIVFAGFFLACAGAGLIYFCVPREVLVRAEAGNQGDCGETGRTAVYLRAHRFAESFAHEFAELGDELSRLDTPC